MSRFTEAKAEADRACDFDPFCLVVATSAASVRYMAGESATAIERCRHVLDMDPGYAPARRLLGAALLASGKPHDAVAELTAAAGHDESDPISNAWLAHALALAGAGDEARALVARLESGVAGPPVSYHLAIAHTGLGNRDAAFRLLEMACRDREPAIINLGVEPRFDPLRRDSRYTALTERLRLP